MILKVSVGLNVLLLSAVIFYIQKGPTVVTKVEKVSSTVETKTDVTTAKVEDVHKNVATTRTVTVTPVLLPNGEVSNATTTVESIEEIVDARRTTNDKVTTEEVRQIDSQTMLIGDYGRTEYSLEVSYARSFSELIPKSFSYRDLEVKVGKRIFSTVWLTGGYRLNNTISIGIRLEF
jgi:hypothetical protein